MGLDIGDVAPRQLFVDAACKPGLFLWNGPLPEAEIAAWLEARGLVVPAALRRLWSATGGGEFFESEELWAPLAPVMAHLDFLEINRYYRERGLAPTYLVFHTSTGLSVVRQPDGALVQLAEPTFAEVRTFASLDEWYAPLRDIFAPRYGLPPAGA